MGYIIIYRRYRNRVAEMLRGFFMIQLLFTFEHMYRRKNEKNKDYERKIKKSGIKMDFLL